MQPPPPTHQPPARCTAAAAATFKGECSDATKDLMNPDKLGSTADADKTRGLLTVTQINTPKPRQGNNNQWKKEWMMVEDDSSNRDNSNSEGEDP